MNMGRRIGIASLIWGSSIFLSRIVGIIREAVIGRVLGAGAEADVYWTAFVLPDYMNYLLAGGALSLVFIPIFSERLTRDGEEGAWESFSAIAGVISILLALGLGAAWFWAPKIVTWIAPGFGEEQLRLLVRLTRIILPAQAFHILGGLLSATLQARDRHALPALAPLVYTGTVIACGLSLGQALGGEAFAWGVLLGSALGPFGMPLIGAAKDIPQIRLRLRPRHSDVRRYLVLSLPIMLAFSIVVVDDWLLKRFGTLIGTGTVSNLQYAKTLMKVPMGMFGLATGVAAFPTLSKLAAEGRRRESFDVIVGAGRVVLLLAFISQAVLTVTGEDVATLIWGMDRFDATTHEQIGLLTGLFCIGLGGWALQGLLARGFYAMGNTWMPSVLGTVVMVLSVPLYAFFGREWGAIGLACASSSAILIYVACLSFELRRRIGGHRSRSFLPIIGPLVICCVAGIVTGTIVRDFVDSTALVSAVASGLTAGIVSLSVARWLRVEEVGIAIRAVQAMVRDPASS